MTTRLGIQEGNSSNNDMSSSARVQKYGVMVNLTGLFSAAEPSKRLHSRSMKTPEKAEKRRIAFKYVGYLMAKNNLTRL